MSFFIRLTSKGKVTTPKQRGFSLLELLAVVTILGILSAVIIPRIGGSTNTARRKMCDQYKGDVNGAIEKYFMQEGAWPTTTNQIIGDDYYPGELPVCPVDGSAYTIDSTTHRVQGHNH